ncbi:2-oxo acid dehydrogenase subunit E2 [Wenzhouxiangella sp. AB-CW3]|uniref:dihydrolipoamide acetyltransferase family protein n=1 Tax=Wenzhouxiangella sp. AB-CW3 TaxID=2771012 RepID=UPI00168BE1D2|nr:dihydrolipoamide acetyltransferase family protein [Wenzhouxiangella sp. AB-CW3]QOC21293.1 2-oxo acid dehydrogenase subunit E2 [Wenzhouxiangella sp. AB-CW3]
MKVFNLPDLGEGLPDAEIVEWLVSEGDEVTVDQPLVSMETAKAVVEVPSPFTGKVAKFHGGPGDVIKTGAPLAEFQVEGDAGAEATTQTEPPATETQAADDAGSTEEKSDQGDREDSGTVVGKMQAGGEVLRERTSTVGGVKVTPAVRALARKLKVDLAAVQASGADGVVTAADVRKAAEDGSAPAGGGSKPEAPAQPAPSPQPQPAPQPQQQKTEASPEPAPRETTASGDWEPVRGTRRTMARVMSESHRSVVPTTLMDDADIQGWKAGEDITVRLLRALWAGASAEPGLNAWFDGQQEMRIVHKNMHVGMAVDTPDGLFVAALRDVNQSDKAGLRGEINRLRENVQNRSIPPEDLKDYTIILSNFGKFAGRYATPVITPPCVAIVAAGALRHEVVPVLGGVEVHKMIPLSLTFDHRACTGGEAARFLKAMLDDLSKAE